MASVHDFETLSLVSEGAKPSPLEVIISNDSSNTLKEHLDKHLNSELNEHLEREATTTKQGGESQVKQLLTSVILLCCEMGSTKCLKTIIQHSSASYLRDNATKESSVPMGYRLKSCRKLRRDGLKRDAQQRRSNKKGGGGGESPNPFEVAVRNDQANILANLYSFDSSNNNETMGIIPSIFGMGLKGFEGYDDDGGFEGDGITLLHIAASFNSLKCLDYMLKSGGGGKLPSKPLANLRSETGETPLHMAALSKNHLAARLVKSYGADLTLTDVDGMTPLHVASEVGCPLCIKEMLEEEEEEEEEEK